MGACAGKPSHHAMSMDAGDVTLRAQQQAPSQPIDEKQVQLEVAPAAASAAPGPTDNDVVPDLNVAIARSRMSSDPAGAPKGSPRASSNRASHDAGNNGQRKASMPPEVEHNVTTRSRAGSSFVSDIANHTAPLTKALSVVHNESSISKMEEVYDLSNATVIGRGGNGSVSVITKRGTDQKFALKTVKTEELTEKLRIELRHEIQLQKSLDHPNIVRVYESFEDLQKGEVCIVMELCTGGSLVSRLGSKLHRHGYGEAAAATLMEEMLSSVFYCHQHKVVHRDIKLDNFIFENESEDSVLKLIDFGYACEVVPGQENMWEKLGTPSYMAPELWEPDDNAHVYDSSVDMWALGVVCFLLLSGQRPWFHKDMRERARMIREDPVSFASERWARVSAEAKDFVLCLLQKVPAERMSARDAMSHPWIKGRSKLHQVDAAHDLEQHEEIVQSLQAFSHVDELKKVALEVIAFATPAQKLDELRDVFVHMDEDNSGTISIEEFRKAMSLHPEIPMDQVEQMFMSMDQNHSGEVDYSEFLAAAISSQQAMDAPSVSTAFGLLDKDGDGYLTKADLMGTIGAEGGLREAEVDELLLGAAQETRGVSADGGGASPVSVRTPDEVRLTVQDFKFLMLSSKRKMSLSGSDAEAVSKRMLDMAGTVYRNSTAEASLSRSRLSRLSGSAASAPASASPLP